MRTIQSLTIVLLLATTCHAVQVTDYDDAGTYEWILNEYYSQGIVKVPRLDVPQLLVMLDAGKLTVPQFMTLAVGKLDVPTIVSILQSRGLTMPDIRDMLRGYGLAVDNVALEYGTAAKKAAILTRWKLPPEIADCLASPTPPVSTAVKPPFFVAMKGGRNRFLEIYEKDIGTVVKILKVAEPKSVILALDYKWRSIETLEFLQLYADRLHSVILLWGVHNAIDQKDFTEAGKIYMQLYALVKCVGPSIFVWKQVCLVTAEDGIFKWLEAVNGPCDGYAVWGPYMLPEQIFADSSIARWREALPDGKPIALGSLFSKDDRQIAYAQKAGYSGIIKHDAELSPQFTKRPKSVKPPEPSPVKPPSRWDN